MFQKNDSINKFDYIIDSRDFFGFNMFMNSINVLSQISENDVFNTDTYIIWKGWYDLKKGSIKKLGIKKS